MRSPAPAFRYARPTSLAEALGILASSDGDTAILAGGTDFVTMRASDGLRPRQVVDLKGVAGLGGIERGKVIRIGAATPMAVIAGRTDRELFALRDGAALVGSAQIRNRATLGGNVCRSSPAGDTLPGLLVLDARLRVSGGSGDRTVELGEFFTGPGTNDLGATELVSVVELPVQDGGSAYQRLTYRAWMDLAVMGVAARLMIRDGSCVEAAVALGGVAPKPILVPETAERLVGTELGPGDVDGAVEAAVAASAPIDDVRGSRAYRIRGIRALMPRVLRTARDRAEGPSG